MDAEMPSVFSETVRKAHREHKCCECHQVIKAGEKYQLFKGCWDGEFARFKTCLPCVELRDEAASQAYERETPAFGYLSEWAHEAGVIFPVARDVY